MYELGGFSVATTRRAGCSHRVTVLCISRASSRPEFSHGCWHVPCGKTSPTRAAECQRVSLPFCASPSATARRGCMTDLRRRRTINSCFEIFEKDLQGNDDRERFAQAYCVLYCVEVVVVTLLLLWIDEDDNTQTYCFRARLTPLLLWIDWTIITRRPISVCRPRLRPTYLPTWYLVVWTLVRRVSGDVYECAVGWVDVDATP